MSVLDRMSRCMVDLDKRWAGKRRPMAFYLIADDWREFMATEPPRVETMFGNNPPIKITDPAFEGVPVRESTGKESRLYDNTTTGRAVPK